MLKKCSIAAYWMIPAAGLILANPTATPSSGREAARLYVVFFSLSPQLSNRICAELESKRTNIEFKGKNTVSEKDAGRKDDDILATIEHLKSQLDGLVLFCGGFSDERYLLTGLPTLIVDCSSGNAETGCRNATALAEKKGTHFIIGCYSTKGFSSDPAQFVPGDIPTLGAADILSEKIKLFEVISRLKQSTFLTIQDYDRTNPIGREGWGALDALQTPYDRDYPRKLKESLGVDIVIVRSTEYYAAIRRVNQEKAREIADTWIDEAEAVIGVAKDDIVRSAGLYLAMKELLATHHADAITMSSWALIPDGVVKAMPPLAEMELAKSLVPCCCESMINCLVTQTIGTYITGRPGYAGDILGGFVPAVPASEIPKNMLLIGHCYGPINPHGNDRVGYSIRNHAYYELGWARTDNPRALWKKEKHVKVNEELKKQNITLVAIRVKWPVDEVVTVVKTNVFDKQIEIYTGRTVDGNYLYKDFDNRVCRTKMAISLDTPLVPRRRDRWGCHRVVFYGDHRRAIKDFASLVGFEVLE